MVTLTFGGWYQRTTMHLTEIFQFVSEGVSKLDLDKDNLLRLRDSLQIEKAQRKSDYLEYIEIITKKGIKIKYYEDGLYIFETESKNISEDLIKLKDYFENQFKPAIDYIFSLGAPTPKILANIKEDHPFVIGETVSNLKGKNFDEKVYGKIYSDTYSKDVRVLKTNKFIIVLSSKKTGKELSSLIDMQIFFREFKSQLHRYLNIHRTLWEEVSKIKEQKELMGGKVPEYKSRLENYGKTVSLISNRINQMGSYAKTRSSISMELGVDKNLASHFHYKYEDLFSSLEYIKEIWKMTTDYVNSAIQIMRDTESKTTNKSLKSIQLLASIGVITGIVRFMYQDSLIPPINLGGIIYIAALGLIALLLDWGLTFFAKRKKYKIKFAELTKDI